MPRDNPGWLERTMLALFLCLVLVCIGFIWAHTASADDEWQEYVRVTYYTLPGLMKDGAPTHKGAAACSGWIPIGTKLQFSDGWIVTCEDRGRGDCYWKGWVDVWAPSRIWGESLITGIYGEYTWVTVLYWGDGPTDVTC